MNMLGKVFAVIMCGLLCAGGILFSSRGNAKAVEPKTEMAPVINRASHHGVWLRA
jgi:hypothetical protein